ncbi:MAG: hypothetical protein WAJ92_09080 [Candidatus Acidiferrales bacterium]
MRRTVSIAIIFLLLAPGVSARSKQDWENVKRIKEGTAVEIFLRSGERVRGEFESASDAAMEVYTLDRMNTQAFSMRRIDRTIIQRVVSFRQPNLPDLRKWMVAGAIGGSAVGVTVGAVEDVRNGTNFRWLEGGFAGALLGFFASCAALTVTATVESVRGLHGRKVVFEATNNNLPNREGSTTGGS